MQEKMPVTTFCEGFMKELQRNNYASGTVKACKRITNQVTEYAAQQEADSYTSELGQRFVDDKYPESIGRFNVEIRPCEREARRIVTLLDEFKRNGILVRKSWRGNEGLEDDDIELLARFSKHLSDKEYASATAEGHIHHVRQFLRHLRCTDRAVKEITENDVVNFITARSYQSQETITLVIGAMKQFFRFLFIEKVLASDLTPLLPKTHRSRLARIPLVWKESDIEKLLGAVDRGSPVGKRDYAILLLAVRLGIRSGDIFSLKKENIKWKDCRIEFIQSKTKQAASLPLQDDVGWALIEYLKNGRPDTESPHIFVSHSNNSFGEPLKSSYGYVLMEKYIRTAGIRMDARQKHGLHSLRHTLACRLLEAKTPLPIISGILVQVSPEAVEQYLKVDIESLRQCALDPEEVFANAFNG